MTPIAVRLARWACDLEPAAADVALASRSLRDTVAVAIAAREHPVTRLAARLPDGAHWAVAGHVLDYDDLHMPLTTHISAVCVPAGAGHGRRGPRLPGRGRGDGAARHRARLAALLGGLACHLHGRGPGRAAGAAVALGLPAGSGRHGHGAGRARGGRGAARVRHGRQVLQVGLRRGDRDPGRPAGRGGRAAPTRPPWTTGSPWSAATRPRLDPDAVSPGRPGGARRAGGQDLPVLLCAAAPDQRAGPAGQRQAWTRRRCAGSCCPPRRPRSCR